MRRTLASAVLAFTTACGPGAPSSPKGETSGEPPESTSGPATSGDSSSSGPAGGASSSTSDGAAGPCPLEEQARCDGECVSLLLSNGNCGECGRICGPYDSECRLGECTPAQSDCVEKSAESVSCASICADEGRECIEESGQAGISFYATADCSGDKGFYSLTCDDPIDWSMAWVGANLEPAVAVRCMCTPTPYYD